jgi:hypothetical protein
MAVRYRDADYRAALAAAAADPAKSTEVLWYEQAAKLLREFEKRKITSGAYDRLMNTLNAFAYERESGTGPRTRPPR